LLQEGQAWVESAASAIQARLDNDSSGNYNLMAMCADTNDILLLRQELARNIAHLEALESKWKSNTFWGTGGPGSDSGTIANGDSAALARFDLDQAQVRTFSPLLEDEDSISEAFHRREQLVERQKILRQRYTASKSQEDNLPKLAGLSDFTPAIDQWVKKLAAHGILEGLHKEVASRRAN
jgi:hypothetical protein